MSEDVLRGCVRGCVETECQRVPKGGWVGCDESVCVRGSVTFDSSSSLICHAFAAPLRIA